MNYISNSGSTFNLDADKIIYLNDVGVPKDLVNAMMQRDQFLQTQMAAASAPPPQPQPESTANYATQETAPPPEPEVVDGELFQRDAPALRQLGGHRRLWPLLAADGGGL